MSRKKSNASRKRSYVLKTVFMTLMANHKYAVPQKAARRKIGTPLKKTITMAYKLQDSGDFAVTVCKITFIHRLGKYNTIRCPEE